MNARMKKAMGSCALLSALALSGCTAGAPPVDGMDSVPDVKQLDVFEFGPLPQTFDASEVALRIPDRLAALVKESGDDLLVSGYTATRRDFGSSSVCGVDLAIEFVASGKEALEGPIITEEAYRESQERQYADALMSQFGVSTEAEALAATENDEEGRASLLSLKEYYAIETWATTEPALSVFDAEPISELDPEAPEPGYYLSADHDTLTAVTRCATSPESSNSVVAVPFPRKDKEGYIDRFITAAFTVMKSGTLTVVDADTFRFVLDSEGTWLSI